MSYKETTYIPEASLYVCNFCGAFAEEEINIRHFDSCTRDENEDQYYGYFD